MKQAEFDGTRAEMYEIAIAEFPKARRMDVEAMYRLLDPRRGEKILGFGEGNGYFAKDIAEAVGAEGHYIVTDPSIDQLDNLQRRIGGLSQMEVKVIGAEGLDVPEGSFDKVWSFGAFHHVPNQTEAMKKIYGALKPGGKAVVCDVFQGSDLARHFDSQVAKYCVTGHEVKFLSEEFARTLTHLAGFKDGNVKIIDLPQQWKFESERDIGEFIYNLHAMTELNGEYETRIDNTLKVCRSVLGIENSNGEYRLNWPMKALVTVK